MAHKMLAGLKKVNSYKFYANIVSMLNDFPKIVDIHTHLNDGVKSKDSAGIHPWELVNFSDTHLKEVEKLLQRPETLFLGEIGLDRAKKEVDFKLQKKVFLAQLELNNSYLKPVIIHAVRSSSDILEIRKKFKHQTWIIHGFRENAEVAKALLNSGCYLSFGVALITSKTLPNLFKELPLTSLFLETDAQKDYAIEDIYHKAAEIKSIPLDELIKILYENFWKIF